MPPLLKQIADLAAKFFSLSKDVTENKADIVAQRQELKDLAQKVARQDQSYNDLRQEVRDLAAEVRGLRSEMQAGWAAQARERQILLLQLENALMRREAGLPPRTLSIESAPDENGEAE